MSGTPVAMPVVPAVNALITAFHDGCTIVDRLREQRLQRGAIPPADRLQRVLRQGAQEVEQTRDEGVEEYGPAFEKDAAIASKLKDVAIVLHNAIIPQFTTAYMDDNMDDFGPAVSAIIQARKEAVNILNEHYMFLSRKRRGESATDESNPRPKQPSSLFHRRTSEFARAPPSPPPQRGLPPVPPLKSQQRSEAWKLFPQRPAEPRIEQLPSPEPPESSSGSSQPVQNRAEMSNKRIQEDPPKIPAQDDFSQKQVVQAPLSPESTPRADSQSLPESEGRRTRASSFVAPSFQQVMSHSSGISTPLGGTELIPICEYNKFGGLCKGAHFAQQLNLKKAMEAHMKNLEWMFHCRKCKFSLKADPTRKGNPRFDDRIQQSGSMYFRMLFLFKSHVPAKKNDVGRSYKCILCLLAGAESATYRGEDLLFAHVARHESSVTGAITITGPIEVTDSAAMLASMETFDIHFPRDKMHATNGFEILPESSLNIQLGRAISTRSPEPEPGQRYRDGWLAGRIKTPDRRGSLSQSGGDSITGSV